MLVDVLRSVPIKEGEFVPLFKGMKPLPPILDSEISAKTATLIIQVPLDLAGLPSFEGVEGEVRLVAVPQAMRNSLSSWSEPLGSVREDLEKGLVPLMVATRFVVDTREQFDAIHLYGLGIDFGGAVSYIHTTGTTPVEWAISLLPEERLDIRNHELQTGPEKFDPPAFLPQNSDILQHIRSGIMVPPFQFDLRRVPISRLT